MPVDPLVDDRIRDHAWLVQHGFRTELPQASGDDLDVLGQILDEPRQPEIKAEDIPHGSSYTNGHLYGAFAMDNILSGDLSNPDSKPAGLEEAPAELFDPRTGTTYHGFRFPGNVVQDPRIPVGTVAMLNNNCHMVLMTPDGRTVECDVRDVMLSIDPVRAMSERIALKAGEFGNRTIKGTMQMSPESHRRLMQTFGFTDEQKPVVPEEDLFEDRTW